MNEQAYQRPMINTLRSGQQRLFLLPTAQLRLPPRSWELVSGCDGPLRRDRENKTDNT